MREVMFIPSRVFGFKRLVTLLLVLGVWFASSNPALAVEARVGFIDVQKALVGTKEWKRKFSVFKNDFKKEKTIIATKEKKMKRMLEDLNKQSFVLDPELKKKKEENFRKKRVAFERYIQDRNAEFAAKEKDLGQKMLKRMAEVIQKIGKEKKYTMILEKKAVLYHNQGNDLTSMTIKTYDKEYK